MRCLPTTAFACWLLAAALAPAAACEAPRTGPPEGAWRSDDGSLLSVLPEGTPGRWRITHFGTGASHVLHPAGDARFESAADLDSAAPVAYTYTFEPAGAGTPPRLAIRGAGTAVNAVRLPLRERAAAFAGAGAQLAGRLTLPPAGPGPFKAVIFVHGSDPVPSVGREWLAHLLAAHGIATLVFDKRGTGCSTGPYVQHVGTLSDDVVAAARWLRAQPEIDPRAVGLAGFSQGGWVAPLAAAKDPALRFVAVAYGLAMSMADEDRLEAPQKLADAGVGPEGVAESEQLNRALHALARGGFADWPAFERELARFEGRPWLAVAARQESWLGRFLQMGLPQAKAVAPEMFRSFFQPFDDPVPTLEWLDVPMLWLVAAQDREAPPAPTLAVLLELQRRGKPLSLVVFPNADHGLFEFAVADGRRVRTKYADGYFETLLRWIQRVR